MVSDKNEEFIEQKFFMNCSLVIDEVVVTLYSRNKDCIFSNVACKYIGGGHGEMCKLTGVSCVYNVALPIKVGDDYE